MQHVPFQGEPMRSEMVFLIVMAMTLVMSMVVVMRTVRGRARKAFKIGSMMWVNYGITEHDRCIAPSGLPYPAGLSNTSGPACQCDTIGCPSRVFGLKTMRLGCATR